MSIMLLSFTIASKTMSRSNMYNNLFALLSEGAITLQDLDDFSEDLKGRFAFVMRDQ